MTIDREDFEKLIHELGDHVGGKIELDLEKMDKEIIDSFYYILGHTTTISNLLSYVFALLDCTLPQVPEQQKRYSETILELCRKTFPGQENEFFQKGREQVINHIQGNISALPKKS